MAAWNDGYIFDVAYTTGFYREISPGWISAAAMLLGPILLAPSPRHYCGCRAGARLRWRQLVGADLAALPAHIQRIPRGDDCLEGAAQVCHLQGGQAGEALGQRPDANKLGAS